MDDESGESMEPMEEVPLIGLGDRELERLVIVAVYFDGEKPRVDSRDEEKHTGRNNYDRN